MSALVLLAVWKLTLRLEIGPEYDSNANRAEVVHDATNPDPPVGSALVRTTARLGFAWKRGANLLKLSAGFGGKVFFDPAVADQSVIVAQTGLEDRLRITRHADLTLAGDYYDAFQNLFASTCTDCLRRRDFRTGTANLRLTAYDGPGAFWLGAGYRGFQYKPDAYFDFQAPTGEVGASTSVELGTSDNPHELTFAASYRLEHRQYGSPIQSLGNAPGCSPEKPVTDVCLTNGNTARADWYHEAGAELGYVGVLLVSLGYTAQLDQSNSFGQSLLRHVITLKLAYRLPWALYATLKAQLMVTKYLDPVLLDQRISTQTFVTIEDENRNAVIVDLERAFGKRGLSVNARYSYFTNALGSPPTSFQRQVAYLGLTYRFEAR